SFDQPQSHVKALVMKLNSEFRALNFEEVSPAPPQFAATGAVARHVEAALRHSGYLPLRDVTISVGETAVTLAGRVPRFHLKHLAQTVVQEAARDWQVCNELEVVSPKTWLPK